MIMVIVLYGYDRFYYVCMKFCFFVKFGLCVLNFIMDFLLYKNSNVYKL